MKRLLLLACMVVVGLQASLAAPKAKAVPAQQATDNIIFHAWCWSLNTIRENLKSIADAGFNIVQTSPVHHCVKEVSRDKGGGPNIFGHGRWYYVYQPTDFKIGNYMLGTRDDLVALCKEAKKYGIRIIVDVVPNHTSINDCQVEDALDAAVGGHENLYHANGFDEIKDYNDRLQCTTGQMGGLPDINTENPDYQHYFLSYLNDLLACGVRGFRYDTAKHIGLPDDPLDPKSKENDFWLVATGQKAVKGLKLALPLDSLFEYGEVLQDRNVKETEYADMIGAVCASSFGWCLRDAMKGNPWKKDEIQNYCHPAKPSQLVTWVESHDTYCNNNESAVFTDAQIRMGWVFITARQYGSPLFYDRPDGSAPGNLWGNNLTGKKGNDAYTHPEVVAVNKFRHQMNGQPEQLVYANGDKVVEVARGKKGAAVVNFSDQPQTVSMATTLPNGKYRDAVYGTTFQVKGGKLTGSMKPLTSYILVK